MISRRNKLAFSGCNVSSFQPPTEWGCFSLEERWRKRCARGVDASSRRSRRHCDATSSLATPCRRPLLRFCSMIVAGNRDDERAKLRADAPGAGDARALVCIGVTQARLCNELRPRDEPPPNRMTANMELTRRAETRVEVLLRAKRRALCVADGSA